MPFLFKKECPVIAVKKVEVKVYQQADFGTWKTLAGKKKEKERQRFGVIGSESSISEDLDCQP
jgi:hypothetical protein